MATLQTPVGIRLDLLRSVMDDIDGSPKLKVMFGSPVCSKLGIVSMENDLKIAEGGLVKLSEADKKKFLDELNTILKKRLGKGI